MVVTKPKPKSIHEKTLIILSALLSAGTLFAATAPYPINVCLVTGEVLGSMGNPNRRMTDCIQQTRQRFLGMAMGYEDLPRSPHRRPHR